VAQRTQCTLVYSIHVLQDSVATRLTCGGNFSGSFIVNFPWNAPVKIFEDRLISSKDYGQVCWHVFFWLTV